MQTSLVFSVGEEEVPSFRMVERHYFRDQVGDERRVRLVRASTSGNRARILSRCTFVPLIDDRLVLCGLICAGISIDSSVTFSTSKLLQSI